MNLCTNFENPKSQSRLDHKKGGKVRVKLKCGHETGIKRTLILTKGGHKATLLNGRIIINNIYI